MTATDMDLNDDIMKNAKSNNRSNINSDNNTHGLHDEDYQSNSNSSSMPGSGDQQHRDADADEMQMLLLHHYNERDSNLSDVTATTAATTMSTMSTTSSTITADNDLCNKNDMNCINNKDTQNNNINDNTNINSVASRKGRTKDKKIKFNDKNKERKMKEAEEELARRANKRHMTSTQELWNAITIIPAPAYCLYYIFTGAWLNKSDLSNISHYYFDQNVVPSLNDDTGANMDFNTSLEQQEMQQQMDEWASSTSCIQSPFLPNLHSLPPPTFLFMTIACTLHAPCSMYYHLLCAYKLPPGPKRMDHWARRLDQAMIHFMSFMYAYTTSANTDYLLLTMAFNIDCMYRLFQKGMRPKQTLYRMIMAFLFPVLPILFRGDVLTFFMLFTIYSVSGWLFSAYPFGGWSHCVFHFIIFLSNPILMKVSLNLDAQVVRESIDLASKCALVGQNSSMSDVTTGMLI